MFASGANTQNGTRGRARIVVCGNEKGGSGKSTIAMHIAIVLLQDGYRVATIDLDGRQLSLTRYLENRDRYARRTGVDLPAPRHFHVPPSGRETIADTESEEFRLFSEGLAGVDRDFDFVVIDTPGTDTFLSRLAHRFADTLVTPMNESFVDLDVLARVDPVDRRIMAVSPYALSVCDARRERRRTDGAIVDWVVVRNRMATVDSGHALAIDGALRDLTGQLGFRVAEGITERMVYREFFPLGLTALDDFEENTPGSRPSLSHLAARQEIRQLIRLLRLPSDIHGRERTEKDRRSVETLDGPVPTPDILVS